MAFWDVLAGYGLPRALILSHFDHADTVRLAMTCKTLLRVHREQGGTLKVVAHFGTGQGADLLKRPELVEQSRLPLNGRLAQTIARGGHLSCLQWAFEKGCFIDSRAFAAAAAGGHVEVMRWLKEQEFPINLLTAADEAAFSGYPEVLEFLIPLMSTYDIALGAFIIADSAAEGPFLHQLAPPHPPFPAK